MSMESALLVQHAQAGDDKALSALVRLYQTPALRVAQNILGSLHDAEDAVQEAWLLAVPKLGTLRDPTRFGPWLYRIVANVALRQRQRRAAQPDQLALLDEAVAGASEASESRLELLPLALDALSAKDAIVVTLHYFGGVPIAAIARLLAIPPGTVKSRLHHARQILHKEIIQMSKNATQPEHVPADFRRVISGMQGEIEWQQIFSGDFAGWSADGSPVNEGSLPPSWEAVGHDGVVGENYGEGSRLLYGDPSWRGVELSLLVTPLAGGNAELFFRVNDSAGCFYAFDLLIGWQAAVVRRVTRDGMGNPNATKLSVVNYPLVLEREYTVTVAVRDHSITTYIDGALVNQVTDDAWLHGQVGLNVWQAKTLYRDIRLRQLS